MAVIRIFRKLLLVCLLLSLMDASAQAITMNTTLYATDDLSIKMNASSPLNTSYDYTTSVGGTAKMISYLKFNISGLSDLDINSIKLNMYGNIDPDSDITTNKIGIYYVENDSWNETSSFSWATRPAYTNANLIASTSHSTATDSYNNALYSWNLFPDNVSLAVLSAEISTGTLSIALQDISIAADGDIAKTVFLSQNNSTISDSFKPQLYIEYEVPDPVPAPEPSGLILGFLGVSGLIGFKRKK